MEARILILLSDGTDTGSRMAPAKAADIAAKNGVVIHTIAVGDPEASADAERVDVAALQAIAAATGGSFNRAEDATGLAAIYDEIDAAGERQGQTTSWRPRTPLTVLPAATFVALVIAGYGGSFLAAWVRRRRVREVAA